MAGIKNIARTRKHTCARGARPGHPRALSPYPRPPCVPRSSNMSVLLSSSVCTLVLAGCFFIPYHRITGKINVRYSYGKCMWGRGIYSERAELFSKWLAHTVRTIQFARVPLGSAEREGVPLKPGSFFLQFASSPRRPRVADERETSRVCARGNSTSAWRSRSEIVPSGKTNTTLLL